MPKEEKPAASSSLSGRCNRLDKILRGLTEEQLEERVNGFNEDNFIGNFQFGDVYRGTFKGDDVIVKIWRKEGKYHQALAGENEWRLQDEMILHEYFKMYEFHPNVVKLREFCRTSKYLAIIYLLNPKPIDTLHNLIEKDDFTWAQRIHVAFGFASLLRYLHTPHPKCTSDLPYLICNIDAAHILVDQDYEPLLFDFSMISGGMLTDKRDLLNQCIQDHRGYNDPVNARPGRWSDKCDVFSYGVLLLSLISKRIYKDDGNCTNVPFVYEWAKNKHKQQNKSCLVHQSLRLGPDFHLSDEISITDLAMLCVECDPEKRPTMDQVVKHMQNLHIVRHNADSWECCKMLDGVNEVYEPYYSYSIDRPGRLPREKRDSDRSHTRSNYSIGGNNVIKVFSYEDLSRYTGRFSKENLIGEFQFGKIFHGMIERKKVVVKIWEHTEKYGSYVTYSKERLKDEISLLQHSQLSSHPNLAKMIGYCFEDEKVGCVYNLDAQDSLYNLAPKDEFTWFQRVNVIYEFASLLKLLHAPNPPNPPYRIGNIDAAHIILDKDYAPKLLDFGMTIGGIILSLRESRTLCWRGCHGYIDSEQGSRHEEEDVFAYGIILLCLISKRIPKEDDSGKMFYAGEWGLDEYNIWVNDGKSESEFSLVHEDLRRVDCGFCPEDGVALTELGLDCLEYVDYRPSMEEVVDRLLELRVIRDHAETRASGNRLTGTMLNFGGIYERKFDISLLNIHLN